MFNWLAEWFTTTPVGLWIIIKQGQADERRHTIKEKRKVLHARTRAKGTT